MIRTKILGLGSLRSRPRRHQRRDRFLDDQHVRQETSSTETDDEWIQQRTGIKERRYVPNDGTWATSDLALEAAKRALADAASSRRSIDCIIFATLSPTSTSRAPPCSCRRSSASPTKTSCACFDIRQQCSGFVYGLQMADAFIRTGMYKRILLVGAELHSHSLDYTTRGRDVMVLFGDGAGAMVLGPMRDRRSARGRDRTRPRHADGTGAMDLYLKIFEIAKLPYVDYDAKDREQNQMMYPQMDGKRVFLNAVRGMVMSHAGGAREDRPRRWDDIDWFVPHQANLRINEKVVEVAEDPAGEGASTRSSSTATPPPRRCR